MGEDKRSPAWTLEQVRASKLALEVHCQTARCGWFGEFDLEGLIDRFGADYTLPTESLDMPCPKCSGRKLKFLLASSPPED